MYEDSIYFGKQKERFKQFVFFDCFRLEIEKG